GQITGGDFASFIIAFFMMNEPIKKFNGFSLKIQEGHAAAIRVYEIIDSNWQIEEVKNPIKLQPITDKISIKISSFAYQEQVVLKNIDISLKAGTVTALVGASGSGKTTLANLIPRFYDLKEGEGEISIDSINIRQSSLDSLRGQIAIVTQEVVLFNDSVRANISYGDINCDQQTLESAAKDAFAHEFITSFENGYDQEVGEKGVMLSGGQRQRIAIARALIKNAPILILDEATSALDTESELEVQRAIENLVKDRTTLVIAHRLSTIYKADIIHVLKDGEIIESGTHKELLKADGEYNKLYQIQFKDQLQTVK
ncbi:MAG: ATP-binding cassette domain-containing protein, partial [SAR324 cluster bacterium]|nr:ATP-binding cassette domain-containing protein [SAR324 cluster bacterium]